MGVSENMRFVFVAYYERARRAKRVPTEYTKNMSMSGRPAGRGHAFERLISLEP